MDGFGSGHRPYGNDRRNEIVSGKGSYEVGVNNNQIYGAPVPSGSSVSKPWGFNDSETKRKKRIAKYKVYTAEGKVKASLRKGLRWIKNKCSRIVHG